MNWSLNIGVIPTIIVSLLLIVIYRRREENEDNLGWKIIGYYLLGGFNLSFNNLLLPIGIAIYFLFFRPSYNGKIKTYTVLFGFVMMLIGYFLK
jgi:hypothetical protein